MMHCIGCCHSDGVVTMMHCIGCCHSDGVVTMMHCIGCCHSDGVVTIFLQFLHSVAGRAVSDGGSGLIHIRELS